MKDSYWVNAISQLENVKTLWQNRGKHHPDTINFWRAIQVILEKRNNVFKQIMDTKQYAEFKTFVFQASNRFPSSNENFIYKVENPLNGFDT